MDKKAEDVYWQFIESIITQANQFSEKTDPGVTSQALLAATARYSAFYLAVNSESKEALEEDKQDVVAQITREFKKALFVEVEDFIENFEEF